MGKSFPGCDCRPYEVIFPAIGNYLSLIKSLAAYFANALQWPEAPSMTITD